MAKYKLTWKDLTWKDFKIYLFSLFKAFIPKTKITNLDELEDFIQSKSAWVTQVTLYGYLKTRMGTKYVLHFDDDGAVCFSKDGSYYELTGKLDSNINLIIINSMIKKKPHI